MAKLKIRYFVELPGKTGSRYFWQPSSPLRALGWRSERLPDDRTAAIARAEALNIQLDGWRKGEVTAIEMDAAPASMPARGPQPGTMADLIHRYRHSRFYPAHPKTRYGYEQNIKVIEEWAGEVPVSAITPKRIEKLYEGMRAKTPAKANAVITMLRMLLKHAVREQIISSHPALAAGPGLVSLPHSGQLWPIDAVALIVETADRMGWHSVGTAVVLNHWIGQRQGDILAMKRAAYRDGRFFVQQQKTGARVAVPHSPWVARRIEAELENQKARKIEATPSAPLLLCDTTGRQWNAYHFTHVFAEIRKAAAGEWSEFFLDDDTTVRTEGLQYMHLRHTAVTELAIAGATVPQIAGITGHTPKSVETILNRYLIRTSELASAATALRLAFLNGICG